MGIAAEKISVLSTYNGQKVSTHFSSFLATLVIDMSSLEALIRDVVRTRCAWNPLFGEPDT